MNFAASMDKISGTLATVKKIQNTDSTRNSSNGKLEVPRGDL